MEWVKLSLLKLQGVQGIDIMFDEEDEERSDKLVKKAEDIAEKLRQRVVKLKNIIDMVI